MPDPDRRERLRSFHQQHSYRLRRVTELMHGAVVETIRSAGLSAHQITARTKTEASFTAKGCKTTGAPGSGYKYEDPERQITDLVGVRVVVPLADDIPAVAGALRAAFEVAEEVHRGNEADVAVPGYQSLHMVVRMRRDAPVLEDEPNLGDTSTEIQVRTILQDALASFEHDLVYKAEQAPTPKTRRRLTELASLLNVADREFSTVRAAHILDAQAVAETPDSHQTATMGGLNLRQIVADLIGPSEEDPDIWLQELQTVLKAVGINDQAAFDQLRPQLHHGPELAARLRTRQPWLTGTQVVDRLLRQALGERYFHARANTVDLAHLEESRTAFDAERSETASIIATLR